MTRFQFRLPGSQTEAKKAVADAIDGLWDEVWKAARSNAELEADFVDCDHARCLLEQAINRAIEEAKRAKP